MKAVSVKDPILRAISGSLLTLPTPSGISGMWNLGSLLGLCLATQLVSGMFLSMHYSCSVSLAFESVNHLMRDVNHGWFIRITHANGASLFFMCVYLHVGRGIYFKAFSSLGVWLVGSSIFMLLMGVAFLGYVLPWGQMSFWGATVITSLASAIPLLGEDLVMWMWGGFSVGEATLTRMFALHFMLPLVLVALAGVHLVYLHENGSSNPLGISSNFDKSPFNPYFVTKDGVYYMIVLTIFLTGVALFPWDLGDPENFAPANPLTTPTHIQPEWYFLFAYAILRSIPNKLGGVLAFIFSVGVLFLFPFVAKPGSGSTAFSPLGKFLFWGFVSTFLLLTWVGARPAEAPFILIGQLLTVFYFSFLLGYLV